MTDYFVTLRDAARGLAKSRAYTALVVTTLGIGAGAATAIFSAVNELMLRPLPLRDSHRLAMVWESNAERGWERVPVAPANAFDFQAQVPSLDDIALVREEANSVALTVGAATVGIKATAATGNLFSVLRVSPMLGRTFTMDESWAESAPVAVLGHAAWVRHFGADSGIVGRLIRLEGAAHEVIGVLPASFSYPMNDAEVWTTFRWASTIRAGAWFRRAHVVRAIARLRDGATFDQASRDLDAVSARLAVEHPGTNAGTRAGLTPLRDFLVGERRTPLLMLLAAAGLLLLIVCANVANLSLARSLARRHQLSVRAALGASARRLAELAFAESACLAVAGAAIGIAAGWLALSVISALRPAGLPELAFRFDWRVFAFAAGVASVCAVLFGLQPALASARTDVVSGLEGRLGLTPGRRGRVGANLLTAIEVALAVVLVVSAGLLVRSIGNLRAVDSGVATDDVITFQVAAPAWKYRTNDELLRLAERVLERIQTVPGVVEAGVARSIPFSGQGWTSEFTVEGWPSGRYGVEVRHRQVTPGYFRALRVPLREGTMFGEQRLPDAPSMVVVNQAFVDQWFPGESPVGRRITYGREPVADAVWHQIVGVVGNERMELEVDPLPEIIEHLALDPPQLMYIVVRREGGVSALARPLQSAVAAIEPEAPLLQLRTMDDVALEALAADRYLIAILGAFAIVALILAAVGVYGVAAQAARSRMHEMGIRIALGAGVIEVGRALLSSGLVFTAGGIATGIAASFATGQLIRTQLFRVEPTDTMTLVTVAVIMLVVALVAMLIPAGRALRVDPVRVLRGDRQQV